MTEKVSSYPSIYAVGHKAIQEIFDDVVFIEEKIDGSQFSFMKLDGELYCRSKGTQINMQAPEGMFAKAIQTVQEIGPLLTDGWVYRCEYLSKPKHNTLKYERTPHKHLIIFDVMVGVEDYLSYPEKADEAQRLGLEVVPLLFHGKITDIEQLKMFLENESILGGCKIEGVVVKNYNLFTRSKKIAIAKFVSEQFKEKHKADWKKSNPTKSDIVQLLTTAYRTEARWQKAVQHLREDGKLEGSPRDIGLLIREVPGDILKECEDEIKEALFKHFWPHIRRGVTRGLPEWYKEQLAQSAFSNDERTEQ